jgi:hypothetical protein
MNLAFGRGLEAAYDHVVLVNSDTVLPANLVDALVATCEAQDAIGSVTPWSNNVSIFSLTNGGHDELLADEAAVDAVSGALADGFPGQALEIPTGVGYCLMVPTAVLATVGIMDPVFGRGYCEEVDLCQRIHRAGLRNVLATGVFVYHEGNATTRGLGLLAHGHTTVWEHERIVDHRYPEYRSRIDDFLAAGGLPAWQEDGRRQIVTSSAHQQGWHLELTPLAADAADALTDVRVTVDPDRPGRAVVQHLGFAAEIATGDGDLVAGLIRHLGGPPRLVNVADRRAGAALLAGSAAATGVPVVVRAPYPASV